MVVRTSYLRRRAQHGRGSTIEEHSKRARKYTVREKLADLVFPDGRFGPDRPRRELEDFPLPDLLSPSAGSVANPERLMDLLDLAFLGRASAGELDRELDAMPAGTSHWVATHFSDDLFLAELVQTTFSIEVCGQRHTPHRGFLERVLSTPPPDLGSIRYRQAILRELDGNDGYAAAAQELLIGLYRLLTLLRASRDDARLEPIRFRIDVLTAFRAVVDLMADRFDGTTSGLQRLHDAGTRIRHSEAFGRMEALLDHQAKMATLQLEAFIGADGRLRHLEIKGLREVKGNPFYRRPLRRWWDRLRIIYRRYNLDAAELVDRLVIGVYQDVAPALARVIQLICHLEIYISSRTFAADAQSRGLEVCLPEIAPKVRLQVEGLFNPLLLGLMERPVPTDLTMDSTSPIILLTGPNSGGKTRLLQAIGIAQVLAHSGLYVPCARGRLPMASGLFASIVELDRADQTEGRLGTELVRLRTLFESVPPNSMVLLDELCSGTNPSEAIEIVDVVLRLLRQIEPVAFVTTHFLDFASRLRAGGAANGLEFLQAEIDEQRGATYRFIPGVATTSLAVGTARRLGVTFHELERTLEDRIEKSRSGNS